MDLLSHDQFPEVALGTAIDLLNRGQADAGQGFARGLALAAGALVAGAAMYGWSAWRWPQRA